MCASRSCTIGMSTSSRTYLTKSFRAPPSAPTAPASEAPSRRPKALPAPRRPAGHYRVRYDHVDSREKMSFRPADKMHHLGIGIEHARNTPSRSLSSLAAAPPASQTHRTEPVLVSPASSIAACIAPAFATICVALRPSWHRAPH